MFFKKLRQDTGKEMVENAITELHKKYALQQEITEELQKRRNDDLTFLMKKQLSIWTGTVKTNGTETIQLKDPIHGNITFESDLAILYLQPIYQRLNDISQLSFSSFYFPTATHSRLSHCVGVSHTVENIINILYKKGRIKLSESEKNKLVLKAKIAALLHDLGHGPFAHALDKYAGLKLAPKYYSAEELSNFRAKPDKYFSIEYIEKYLSTIVPTLSIGIDVKYIQSLLNPVKKKSLTGYDRFISDLIDSVLDADRMDYLKRDAHMTGLMNNAPVDIADLQEHIIPFKNSDDQYTMNYSDKSISCIEKFLEARHVMYQECYDADMKMAAEGMLIRAVEDFENIYKSKIELEQIILLTDGQLLGSLIHMTDSSTLAHKFATMLRQRLIFTKIHEVDTSIPTTNEEINAFKKGAIFARGDPDSDDFVEHLTRPDLWAQKIAGKDYKEKIIIIVPYPESYDTRELNVDLIDEKTNTSKPIREVYPGIKQKLESWNKMRLKIRIFANPNLSPGDIQNLVDRAKKILG